MNVERRYHQLVQHYAQRGYPLQQAHKFADFTVQRELSSQRAGLSSGWIAFHVTMTVLFVLTGLVLAPFTCFISLVLCFYPLAWAFHASVVK